ncbi:MAG TPA: hypothetical protein VLT36_12100 [Candidatus Dormibacteraeota bacterium]|nr:hypothetical protein [Candidatus Dormibacteraeota bacterium]
MSALPGNPDPPSLEAFAPPSNYRFEPELQETPPRHVPEEFRNSPFFVRQRNTLVRVLLAGGLCIVFGRLPIFREWGLYVLPLAYLSWVGAGLLVLGGAGWISSKARRGPIQYVEEGIPLVARIRELVLRPTMIMNGQPTTYVFSAVIEYRDPDTGALVEKKVDSRDFSASGKDKYRTSYHMGEYVTAVYLKSNPAKTLRLYGFLELRPDIGLLQTRAAEPPSLAKTVLGVGAVFAIFAVLFWNVYAFSKYEPLDLSFAQAGGPVIVGGVVLGGGLIAWLATRQARSRREMAARNEKALASGQAVELQARKRGPFGAHGLIMTLVIGAGALMLGGVVVLCWCFSANALLDKSKPEFRPVEIVEFWSTTHSFLFREYEIEYRFPGETKTRKLLSSPAQMARFQSKQGVAEVHPGCFGWSWVETIAPPQAFESGQKANRGN